MLPTQVLESVSRALYSMVALAKPEYGVHQIFAFNILKMSLQYISSKF